MLKNILERLHGKMTFRAAADSVEIPLYAPKDRVDTMMLDLVKGGKAAPMDATILPEYTPRG